MAKQLALVLGIIASLVVIYATLFQLSDRSRCAGPSYTIQLNF